MARALDAWDQSGLFDKSHDKIILYVRTGDEAIDLAQLLGCSTTRSNAYDTKDHDKSFEVES